MIDFLQRHHGEEVTGLELLTGGYWSAAYGYRVADHELVLRVGETPDGFRADERAMAYSSPTLPVPEVVAIGQAFDRWFAISRRHHGRFLEDVGPDHATAHGSTIVALLAALRAVPDRGAVTSSWHDWLVDGIIDRPGRHTSGWRNSIAADPAADRTFRAVDDRIRELLDACTDRRQLVHGDLLHHNVLVTPEADAVTAVFSWKCSTWGDALYDLAWCTFWGRWHEAIGALELWHRVAPTLTGADAVDAAVRHHAYELHIGTSHLAWYVAIDDGENLTWTLRQLDELLERGPHS